MGQSLDCLKGQGTVVSDEVEILDIFRVWKTFVVNRRTLFNLFRRWKKYFVKQRLEWNLYNLYRFISENKISFEFAIMMIRTRRQLPSFLMSNLIRQFPHKSKTLLWLLLQKGLTRVNDIEYPTLYKQLFKQAVSGMYLKTSMKRDLFESVIDLEHYEERKFKARLRHTLARSESFCLSEELWRKIVSYVEYDTINRRVSEYLACFDSEKDAEKEWVLSQRKWDELMRKFKSVGREYTSDTYKLMNVDFIKIMKVFIEVQFPEFGSSLQKRYLLSLTGIQVEPRILWLTPTSHLENPRFIRVLLRKTDLTKGLLNISFQGRRFGDYIADYFPQIMLEILEIKPQVFFYKGFPDRLRNLNSAIKYLRMIDERHLTRITNTFMEGLPACSVSNWYWERHPVRMVLQGIKNAGPRGEKLHYFIGGLEVMKHERESIRMKWSKNWRPSEDNTHRESGLVLSNLLPYSASGRRTIVSYAVLREKEGWSEPIARQREENCKPMPNYSYDYHLSSTLRVTQTEIIDVVSKFQVFIRLTVVPQRLNKSLLEKQMSISKALCSSSKRSLFLVCQYLLGKDFPFVISTVLPLLGDISNP